MNCLAMLGCHDLGKKKRKRRRSRRNGGFFAGENELEYDFNVTVNKHVRGRGMEEFQIKKSNVQQFYELKGEGGRRCRQPKDLVPWCTLGSSS